MMINIIIIIVLISITGIFAIYYNVKRRNSFWLIQDLLDTFNEVFELTKETYEEDRMLEESIEVDCLYKIVLLEDSVQARNFLLDLGNLIIRFEEELIASYGVPNYDNSYFEFRQNLIEVRKSFLR